MSSQSTPDVLFDMRNAFYLGNSQQCINESLKCKVVSSEDLLAKEVLMYRAYVSQRKYGVVSHDMNTSMHSQLQTISHLFDRLKSD